MLAMGSIVAGAQCTASRCIGTPAEALGVAMIDMSLLGGALRERLSFHPSAKPHEDQLPTSRFLHQLENSSGFTSLMPVKPASVMACASLSLTANRPISSRNDKGASPNTPSLSTNFLTSSA